MDYYQFTQDQKYLEEVAYPAMLSLSKFYSKVLKPHGDLLLVEPSASPEQTQCSSRSRECPATFREKIILPLVAPSIRVLSGKAIPIRFFWLMN